MSQRLSALALVALVFLFATEAFATEIFPNVSVDIPEAEGLPLAGPGELDLTLEHEVQLQISYLEDGLAQQLNGYSTLNWLTYEAAQLKKNLSEVNKQSDRAAASTSMERYAGKYRALIATQAWRTDEAVHYSVHLDLFLDEGILGLHFSWSTDPGISDGWTSVDRILSSVSVH